MPVFGKLLSSVKSRAPVFPLLYEDTEVDEDLLDIDEQSEILHVAGPGDRVALHLARHPARIDAVDGNRHHLAWTALKVAAAQHADRHVVDSLFVRLRSDRPEELVNPLTRGLAPRRVAVFAIAAFAFPILSLWLVSPSH